MKNCQKHVDVMKRVFGWTFGYQLNILLQGGAIILGGEGPKGKDIEVWITSSWLEENHCSKHNIDNEKAHTALEHVKRCECELCISTRGLKGKLLPLSKDEELPFWLNAILIRIAVEKTGPKKKFLFSRKNMEPSTEIDTMLEAFSMFIGDNRDFWIWPDND